MIKQKINSIFFCEFFFFTKVSVFNHSKFFFKIETFHTFFLLNAWDVPDNPIPVNWDSDPSIHFIMELIKLIFFCHTLIIEGDFYSVINKVMIKVMIIIMKTLLLLWIITIIFLFIFCFMHTLFLGIPVATGVLWTDMLLIFHPRE